jgi:hypothetical protein
MNRDTVENLNNNNILSAMTVAVFGEERREREREREREWERERERERRQTSKLQ